jgi:uncharacterized protein YjiS (DUF1127 family)
MRVIRNGLVAAPRLSSDRGPLHRIGLVVDMLWEWRRRRRSRHQLKMMSEHMCKDIGISRADAWCEGRKPFWKA